MHIVFWGQEGLPGLLDREKASAQRRVETLARHMASQGNSVTLYTRRGRNSSSLNYHGIDVATGLFPRKDADVYHIHGWKAGIWGVWIRFWNSGAVLVWTIDEIKTPCLPLARRILQRLVAAHFDGITTPTRTIQYQLLNEYGLYSQYIPDGYYPPLLQDVPLKAFGLRKAQYVVLLGASVEKIKEVAQAYTDAGKRRKVVVLQEKKLLYRHLKRRYRFLEFAGELRGRSALSILRNASVVIMNGQETPMEWVLQAMDSGRMIVSSNEPLNQELLGTSAQYFKTGDIGGIASALRNTSNSAEVKKWGRKVALRAQKHLRWQRILPEYESVYQAIRKPVYLDSAVVSCKVPEMS